LYNGELKAVYPDCYRYRLPNTNGDWVDFWISFDAKTGFEVRSCPASLNPYLTLKYILRRLLKTLTLYEKKDLEFSYEQKFGNKIDFIIKRHREGREIIWIEPYYLKVSKKFGFLIDFNFKIEDGVSYSRIIQQLSLSLDQSFRINKSFYLDKYKKIKDFIPILQNIFTDEWGGFIKGEFEELNYTLLDQKQYLVENDYPSNAPFLGIGFRGPYKKIDGSISIVYIYQDSIEYLVKDLHKALSGELFPTFKGLNQFFKLSISRYYANPLQRLDEIEIKEKIQDYSEQIGHNFIIILILPKDTPLYYKIKYYAITHGIPLQVVTMNLLQKQETFKWSTSNIALQIFVKLGGIPWKIKPKEPV